MEGFFLGESIPVNDKLSEIFLQLHISEKSGRGVPKITEMYGKEAFTFRENFIVVTMREMLNAKFKILSELTEHTLANEIEAPKEIQRKEFQ